MKNWSRIKDQYDGGFTEMYLDLYKIESEFVLKGTSVHYNAGAEKVLCEILVPNSLRNAKDILKYIADNRSYYSWAKISLKELKKNKDLVAFIEENI